MFDLLIVTANKLETTPIVSKLKNCKKLSGFPVKIWQGSWNDLSVAVACIGIGNTKITEALSNVQTKQIVNIGIAGALTTNHKIGDWLSIGTFIYEGQAPIILNALEAKLLTVDKPILNQQESEQLFDKYATTLVDMEGFHIARYCIDNQIKFQAIKMISDNANQSSQTDYKLSLEKYGQECLEVIRGCLRSKK